jgi:predicted Zn finger-like uncharacterized protein
VLIDCPGCSASYHITKAALGPSGRKVACPRCETVWLAKPAAPEPEDTLPTDTQISSDHWSPAGKHTGYARAVAAMPVAAPRRAMPPFVHNFFAGTLLLVLAMGLLASRDAIARVWPGAGRLYVAIGIPVAHDGLAIQDLHTVLTHVDGAPYLGVEGVIVNLRRGETPVPSVRLAIRDADQHELYAWTVALDRRSLPAGETLLFRARLADPPADGRDVVARFVTTGQTLASQ